MPTEDAADEFIPHALDFFRTCVSATQLRKYSGLFDSDGEAPSQTVQDALSKSLKDFRSDLARWNLAFESPKELFDHLLLAPNLQATYFYRASRSLHLMNVELIPSVIATLSRLVTGMEIYYSTEIGPGLKVIHGAGSLVGAGCRIGSHFTIYQNVTVGDRLGKQTGTASRPIIGDYVIASAGAQILGPVEIGSKSVLGANSLIIHSVPENSISAGVPAKVIANLTEEGFQDFWQAIKG